MTMNSNTRAWKILQRLKENAHDGHQQQQMDELASVNEYPDGDNAPSYSIPQDRVDNCESVSSKFITLERVEGCQADELVFVNDPDGEYIVSSEFITLESVEGCQQDDLILTNKNSDEERLVPKNFVTLKSVEFHQEVSVTSTLQHDSVTLHANEEMCPADDSFLNCGEGSRLVQLIPGTQNTSPNFEQETNLDGSSEAEDSDHDQEYIQPGSEETDSSFEDDPSSRTLQEDQHVDRSHSVSAKKKGRGRKQEETKTRKRKRQPEKWERNARKTARTEGQPYKSSRGKFVPGKSLKPCCECRRKCFEKFDEGARTRLFTAFYKLSTSGQNQFICNHVTEVRKESERLRSLNKKGQPRPKGVASRRNFTRKYELNGLEVCQKMFLNTLCISLMKVRVVVNKRRESGTSVCPEDQRGKHGHQAKLGEEEKRAIRDHIRQFPAYESHYSRQHSEKKYLKSDLSVSEMYRLYAEEIEKAGLPFASETAYRKIFVEEFNLGFKAPKLDTCHKCDKFKLLKDTADPEKKKQIEDEHNKHLDSAQQLYDEKKRDKASSYSEQKIAFGCFDLQQCLPTPLLRSGLSFYKRSLWTFNLTVFSIVDKIKRSSCFMWDETVAQRGGQEIASCVLRFLHSLPDEVEGVNLYSDCCSGQTRNIYFTVMCLLFMAEISQSSKNLKIINHKFLVPGHTHMEADTIHALIEKTKKNQTEVSLDLPKDWMNLIRSIPCQTPIIVEEMTQANFKKFSSQLSSALVHRKTNTVGDPVDWLNIRWLQYRRGGGLSAFYKKSLQDVDFFELDLARKKKTRGSSSSNLDVGPLYNGPLALPPKKVSDLLSVLDYIHPSSRDFYRSMRPDVTAQELPPWMDSDEEEEVE